MNLADFFAVMAKPPMRMRETDIRELAAPCLWHESPEEAAILALRRSGFFDGEAYLRMYHDLASRNVDPYAHYIHFGLAEKRIFPVIGMGEMPLVSVVLRANTDCAALEKSLMTVRSQILEQLEIIVVNENGDETLLEKAQEAAMNDPRIKLIDITLPPQKCGAGMNIGLDYASAPFVAFMEAGDVVDADAYGLMCNECDSYDLDFVKTAYFTSDGQEPAPPIRDFQLLDKIINPLKTISTWRADPAPYAGLYRIEFLRVNNIYFNESLDFNQACHEFWCKIFMYSCKFKLLARPLYTKNGL